jgi:hypothetical protein
MSVKESLGITCPGLTGPGYGEGLFNAMDTGEGATKYYHISTAGGSPKRHPH